MITISDFAAKFSFLFPKLSDALPWTITQSAAFIIAEKIKTLGDDFVIRDGIAIHKEARLEEHVLIKSPAIISAGCFIAAHAYLRGGVFLGEQVSVGPGCEVKSSFVMPNAALAHFNFVGDSIVGSFVNMEAGSILANHFNERKEKVIDVQIRQQRISTGITKFGSLLGDGCKIGANAVLSPGSILQPNTIVKRLELIEQVKYIE
jgi:UDP-N-acetylglucosamine diphosphorylase / glucose-1-phosphate thymidylyltransferase / UDP-N-acetylgalactosamine diphosphorylase / glucosamine-1-phosphate N-acetyltransferase / galactosamine-1-phosphate N-acetyltransferase